MPPCSCRRHGQTLLALLLVCLLLLLVCLLLLLLPNLSRHLLLPLLWWRRLLWWRVALLTSLLTFSCRWPGCRQAAKLKAQLLRPLPPLLRCRADLPLTSCIRL